MKTLPIVPKVVGSIFPALKSAFFVTVIGIALHQSLLANGPINVPGDFPTIQSAVDAAAPGSTILIKQGVYNESILITTPGLELRGLAGPGKVLIDGTGLAVGPGLTGVDGVHVLGADKVTLRNLTVQNFREFVGAGLVAFRAGILVEGSNECTVKNNLAQLNGDGIVLRNSDNCSVMNNVSRNNIHNGFFIRNGSDGNQVTNNDAVDNGPDVNDAPPFVPPGVGCGIQLSFDCVGNAIRNSILAGNGRGLQFDRGSTENEATGNISVENRRFGIAALAVGGQPAASGNLMRTNVALDNGEFDLIDQNFPPEVGNLWENNVFETSNF